MRIAAIGDIHGNVFALDAVMKDIRRWSVDQIIQLGDAFNGPIDPPGVAALLRSVSMVHVRGNGEQMVLTKGSQASRSALFARERLSESDLDWIRDWPFAATSASLCAFHASPNSDVACLVEKLVPGGVTLRDRVSIAGELGEITAPVVFCGHSHLPQCVRLSERLVVVNPGSVGLQAYAADMPIPHKMQTGSPEARYAVVEIEGAKVSVCQRCVAYDVKAAVERAEQSGFAEWRTPLLTGYAGL